MDQLVTIIVPMYNVSEYLCKCLKSINNQVYKNLEIILINDGSTDQTLKIAKAFKWNYSDVKIFDIPNKGVSNARNYGLKKMKKEGFVLFVDPDDYIDENYVCNLVKAATEFPDSIAVCNYVRETLNGKMEVRSDVNVFENKDKYIAVLNEKLLGGYIWNKLYQKKIILENSIFFEEDIFICEDLLFNIRYLKYIKDFVCVDKCIYHYIIRKNSSVNELFDKQKLESQLTAYAMVYNIIPSEYENAKKLAYMILFKNKIYYWIRLYRTGKFQKIDKLERIEIKKMKNNIRIISIKYLFFYYSLLYVPHLLYLVLIAKK